MIKQYVSAILGLVTCAAVWLMMPATSHAQYVIGSWQSAPIPPTPANDEGWQRGQGGFGPNGSIFASSNYPAYFELDTNVVAGYAQSLNIHETGYGADRLYISLNAAQIAALTNNNQLSFTFSVPPATANDSSGYIQLVQFQFNTKAGFDQPAISTAGGFSETGATNNDNNGQPIFYYSTGAPARSQVVTFNYQNLTTNMIGTGYAQIVFIFQTSGGDLTNLYINNVNINGKPTQTVYTVDDFSTNGVDTENPIGNDFYAAGDYPYDVPGNIASIWSEWYANGITSITFDPDVNVSGNTNANGAMALNFTWNGPATDGYQQWVAYQGSSAATTFVPVDTNLTTGIGYPQYTNLEADVMFDPSSAGTTNANGVLGVIRLGIRGVTSTGPSGADWEPAANYVTITNTGVWYHINYPLNPNDANALNIYGPLIGEDVNAYVGGGGLTGNQILYVDNIKFTGPLNTVKIPPPTVATPTKASPGLRIFAGSSINTYDREMLYTVDNNQSWVDPGATYPVSYTFTLQDYQPNINQTMVELNDTTIGTAGEYADYSGPTTLWLQLNPVASGGVMASVQWKTNAPGSNPGGTANPYGQALAFTNSTAVGTWSLVFTSTNTGYVVAPGTVLSGTTNFTINDSNVVSDFAEPMFVAFGIQPNTVVGEGEYIDWANMSVKGVVDGNESEDFTKESSDIGVNTANVTPSGFFNNSLSALPASTIIQTTNDAWWVSWSSPASGFTLTSATNLNSVNWINPGWYSGYADTNAPRVMAGGAPLGGKYWVLLPKDDLPTANGQQNTYTGSPAGSPGPASTPAAPTAFFELSTNTVSP